MSDDYTDAHRLFIQTIMSYRIMEDDWADCLFHKIWRMTKRDSPPEFDYFISTINLELNKIDWAIRQTCDERTGQSCVVLVNRRADLCAVLSTSLSVDEIMLFKQIVAAIINAPDEQFWISSMNIIRLAQNLDMKAVRVEQFLSNVVEGHWLYRCENSGRYAMSVRSLLELGDYIIEQFGNTALPPCNLCKERMTTGERCHKCPIRLHHHCSVVTFSKALTKLCPACKTPWAHTTFGLL